MEIWTSAVIPELNYYFSKYLVSNLGRVKNAKTGRILSTHMLNNITPKMMVYHDNGKQKHIFLRRLVCGAFHKIPGQETYHVHHKNFNKEDCSAQNLEWITPSEMGRKYSVSHVDKKKKGRPILRVKKENDTLIEEFCSITEAAEKTCLHHHTLSYYIKNGKPFRGYYWKYKSVEDLEQEEWKVFEKYPHVLVSNMGRFKFTKTNTLLNTRGHSAGYMFVGITDGYKTKTFLAHRVIADVFIPKSKNKTFIDHKDGNKKNNKASNLRWVTREENSGNPATTRNRPVLQLCYETGTVLRRFEKITDAANFVGSTRYSIRNCCLGKYKHAKGFKWKYDD